MSHEVDCVILWHYYDAQGKLINASGTHLVGTLGNLNDRLREAHDQAEKNREAGQPYSLAAQIIANRI
ncbi:MAG: hypothetical protein JWL82_27 [Parcubacteria group bacterium]|nr:hypothetical protein [Parcubacteria group bacterium]